MLNVRRLQGLFSAPTLLCVAYGLLLVSWAMSNAPFAAADEPAHYVRAIGVGSGHLVGPLDPYTEADFPNNPTTLRWLNDATRAVTVAGGMSSRTATCNAFQPLASAACLSEPGTIAATTVVQNPVGNYQPLPYVLPGLAINQTQGPFTADRVGRLVSAFICWLFLCLAVKLAWNDRAPSLVGTALAVTPMVLFSASVINPSGLEIVAGLAFAAAVLRIRQTARPPTWVWAATAVSGFTLSLSRSPGPIWVVLDLIVLGFLLPWSETRRRVRGQPKAAFVTALVLALGIVLNRAWEGLYGSHLRLTLSEVRALRPISSQLEGLFSQQVGNFGWIDTPMSPTLVAVWFTLVLLLVAVALVLGTPRERTVLTLTLVGCLAGTIGLQLAFKAGTGFDAQGRHVLPFTVMLPLLAGHILTQHHARIPWQPRTHPSPRRGPTTTVLLPALGGLVVAGLVALGQAGGWYTNSRRNAVGAAGPRWFFTHPEWQPPLGWYPWLATTLVASALAALALCLPGGLLPRSTGLATTTPGGPALPEAPARPGDERRGEG